MLTISPVKPREPVLSDETKHKLLAAQIGVEHEREWRWQAVAAVCVAVGLGFFGGNALGMW